MLLQTTAAHAPAQRCCVHDFLLCSVGVILVYDLTNRKTLARLPKWAAEITQYGSFVAPLAEEVALRNIGGLPVPVLVRLQQLQLQR
jgi:hypothetical protein